MDLIAHEKPHCTLLSPILKWDDALTFSKWIAGTHIHLPASIPLSYGHMDRNGKVRQKTHHKCLKLEFSVHWMCIFLPYLNQKYVCLNIVFGISNFGNLPCSFSELVHLMIYLIWELIITIL